VAAALGDPHAGMHAALELPRGSYGLVEFVFRSAPTVREAVDQLVRYAPLINSALRFGVTTRPGRVLIDARIDGEPECLGRQANEFAMVIFLRVGRQLVGKPFMAHRVWFAHAAPANIAPLAAFFGTDDLVFDAGLLAFEFDAALLDSPVATADEALYAFLDQQASERVHSTGTADPLEAVRDAIRGALRKGEPTIDAAAARMGLGVRTLQRLLVRHGKTFRRLVAETRKELATLYLRDRNLPLAEVASLLGYSDLRPFRRAYKRWTRDKG
jgi:AraC-like DNA-binding protein